MVSEAHYYSWVESFLRDSLGCFATKQRIGPQIVGYADAVGIRDVGGASRGDIELVAVEVKLSPSPFGKNLGQARGYSLFAHKCYLAVRMGRGDHFSDSQLELANRLGVGLIEITGWRKKRCTEILSPSYCEPIGPLTNIAIENVGYVRCALCGVVVEGRRHRDYSSVRTRATDLRKILYYSRPVLDSGMTRRLLFMNRAKDRMEKTTYICPDCLTELSDHGVRNTRSPRER